MLKNLSIRTKLLGPYIATTIAICCIAGTALVQLSAHVPGPGQYIAVYGRSGIAATDLEGSAGTLTSSAVRAQQLATTVAAASEEASTNVQSVASAN